MQLRLAEEGTSAKAGFQVGPLYIKGGLFQLGISDKTFKTELSFGRREVAGPNNRRSVRG